MTDNNQNPQPSDRSPDHRGAEVDQQDGGPGSHTEQGTGGEFDDVASGGTSKPQHQNTSTVDEDDDEDKHSASDVSNDHDVHGDADTAG